MRMQQTGTDPILTEQFTRPSGTDRDNVQLAQDMRGPQIEAFRIANADEVAEYNTTCQADTMPSPADDDMMGHSTDSVVIEPLDEETWDDMVEGTMQRYADAWRRLAEL